MCWWEKILAPARPIGSGLEKHLSAEVNLLSIVIACYVEKIKIRLDPLQMTDRINHLSGVHAFSTWNARLPFE